MRLKTFTTNTMAEALRLIKSDLGKDAIILSTRKVQVNGKTGLEITAAVDAPAPDLAPRHNKTIEDFATVSGGDAALVDDTLVGNLRAHGVTEGLIDGVMKAQGGLAAAAFSPLEGLEMILGKRLDLLPLARTFAPGRVHVFVGPTGAGKTTFVGKVAVWGKRGKQSVGILSLDTQKIGGVEPLHVLADALGDIAHVIKDSEDVRALGSKLGKRQLILVDSAGLNPYSSKDLAAFAQQLAGLSSNPVVHLVLPASLSLTELKNTVAAFARFKCQDVIFTKLDETAALGGVINVLAMGAAGGALGRSADMSDGPLALSAEDLAAGLSRPPTQIWEDA